MKKLRAWIILFVVLKAFLLSQVFCALTPPSLSPMLSVPVQTNPPINLTFSWSYPTNANQKGFQGFASPNSNLTSSLLLFTASANARSNTVTLTNLPFSRNWFFLRATNATQISCNSPAIFTPPFPSDRQVVKIHCQNSTNLLTPFSDFLVLPVTNFLSNAPTLFNRAYLETTNFNPLNTNAF